MNATIAERVITCVTRTHHLEPGRVTIESTFEELAIDSLAGINIVFALEEEFGITVPDDAAAKVTSVRDLVAGVEQLLADKEKAQAAGA